MKRLRAISLRQKFGGSAAVLIILVDNGEGAGDPPDQISLVFIFGAGSQVDCSGLILPQNTIEGAMFKLNRSSRAAN